MAWNKKNSLNISKPKYMIFQKVDNDVQHWTRNIEWHLKYIKAYFSAQ